MLLGKVTEALNSKCAAFASSAAFLPYFSLQTLQVFGGVVKIFFARGAAYRSYDTGERSVVQIPGWPTPIQFCKRSFF